MLRSRTDHAGKTVRHHVLPDVFVFYEQHEGPNVLACGRKSTFRRMLCALFNRLIVVRDPGSGVMVRMLELGSCFVLVAERG